MSFDNFAMNFWETVAREGRNNPRGYLSLAEICGLWDKHWDTKRDLLKTEKWDYLYTSSTFDYEPIFETKEFTRKQRIKVFKQGHELYFKKLLKWRFGMKRGFWVYWVGRCFSIRKLLLAFVHTRLGHDLFCILSHQKKEKA